MWEILSWLAILLAIAGLGAVAAFVARGGSPGDLAGNFFKPKPEPRIQVVEYAAMDGKRRLVLIRRDDVEHLLLTGGPVDVVIETGIGMSKPYAVEVHAAHAATIASRPARGFGQRAVEPAVGQPPPLSRAAAGVNRANEPELPAPEPAEARVERG